MAVNDILSWLKKRENAKSHRQILCISGSETFCLQSANNLVSSCEQDVLWLGDDAPPMCSSIAIKHYKKLLGSEYGIVVYNSFSGLQPNALLASAGVIKRHGILVVLCPPLSSWASYSDPRTLALSSYGFPPIASTIKQSIINMFNTDPLIAMWQEDSAARLPIEQTAKHYANAPLPFATQDQAIAHTKILSCLDTPDTANLLIASRGRGKSSLLGLIANELLSQGRSVVVTSAHSNAVTSLFKHIDTDTTCATNEFTRQHVVTGAELTWQTTVSCEAYQPCAKTVLMIDEAANLPLPELKRLSQLGMPLIFSSTIDGYEGTGRGFYQRFIPYLSEHFSALNQISMHTPVRWYPEDTMESTLTALLFQPQPLPVFTRPHINNVEVANRMDESTLSVDFSDVKQLTNARLRQVISLLSYAHYQTSPDDILRLIDSSDSRLVIAHYHNNIVGVAILLDEGGKKLSPLAADIAVGNRRVNGHLSAQSLSLISAQAELACYDYWRINRIAVQEGYQSQHIGKRILQFIADIAGQNGKDGLTVSFGNTDRLRRFWQQSGFSPVRDGQNVDPSSGEKSVLMLKPLSKRLNDDSALLFKLYQLASTEDRIKAQRLLSDESVLATLRKMAYQLTQQQRSLMHCIVLLHYLLLVMPETSTARAMIRDYLSPTMSKVSFARKYQLAGKRFVDSFVKDNITSLLQNLLLKHHDN